MAKGQSKGSGGGGGKAAANKEQAIDFTQNSAENYLKVRPVIRSSRPGEDTKQDEELSKAIQQARNGGYEIINREYTHRGNSGQLYHLEEKDIETPIKNGKISASSNLAKHVKAVSQQYSDVIVLQERAAAMMVGKGRRGFNYKGYSAPYVVMARR